MDSGPVAAVGDVVKLHVHVHETASSSSSSSATTDMPGVSGAAMMTRVKGTVCKVKREGEGGVSKYTYKVRLGCGSIVKTSLRAGEWRPVNPDKKKKKKKKKKKEKEEKEKEKEKGQKKKKEEGQAAEPASAPPSSSSSSRAAVATPFIPGSSSVLDCVRHIVAPMVGASELPFRLLCRRYGASIAYTPMINR